MSEYQYYEFQAITTLPREVCDEWLLRLAQGQEANLSLRFQQYLQAGRMAETVAQGKRTVAELERLAQAERKQANARLSKESWPP